MDACMKRQKGQAGLNHMHRLLSSPFCNSEWSQVSPWQEETSPASQLGTPTWASLPARLQVWQLPGSRFPGEDAGKLRDLVPKPQPFGAEDLLTNGPTSCSSALYK